MITTEEYKDLVAEKESILNFIDENSVDEKALIKEAISKIANLEKEKREIDNQIKEIKKELAENGINIGEFNRVFTTIKTELKMTYDNLKDNINIYKSVIEDNELLESLKESIK